MVQCGHPKKEVRTGRPNVGQVRITPDGSQLEKIALIVSSRGGQQEARVVG